MKPKPGAKKWRPGHLVLHEADPKTHAMLMEVLEIKGNLARTAYLDPHAEGQAKGTGKATGQPGSWHRLELLLDPALFLRTEEYLQTLCERLERKSRSSNRPPGADTKSEPRA